MILTHFFLGGGRGEGEDLSILFAYCSSQGSWLTLQAKGFHLVSQTYQFQVGTEMYQCFNPDEGLTLETSASETLYGGRFA